MDARIKMMEGNVISVRVPIKIKRYSGKKLILLPEGVHSQLSLQDMQTPFPELWEEQLKHFGFVD